MRRSCAALESRGQSCYTLLKPLNIKRPFGMRKDKSPMQETADKKPLSQAFADTATQRQIENDGTHSPSYRTREEEIPRRRNAEETKKRILAAAKELFSQKSYKQVGTRDIAALAEVNVTLIHRYFESKKKLFSEVLMTLGDNVEHAELSRQRARNHIADYFGAGVENRMKELRLILLSATDEEVSDVVSDFYVER
ncbi:MAG: TetR/AcrR family transcriptional regulator, partial [Candidatus Desulfovibrio faecigallinarum]|nr:TetR/AcrR family transcriptional regulator [Candidatus Desulfovibrio faecigallinarum]